MFLFQLEELRLGEVSDFPDPTAGWWMGTVPTSPSDFKTHALCTPVLRIAGLPGNLGEIICGLSLAGVEGAGLSSTPQAHNPWLGLLVSSFTSYGP